VNPNKPTKRTPNTITLPDKRRVVCRIWDHATTADRYTVALKGYRTATGMVYPYLAADERPHHPQGFGQHGESPTFLTGRHLGRRIRFDDLPADTRLFIVEQFC